ncbi:murein L,D-transpeptidase catalytic domain family protein [Rufibacter sp. LB8]|uniref:murein L,D-transpeptidase catalytic domain family protein n=1 Tax=Rufibacter sp. LB8 TaxID=2777781 RepID=UPI00178C80EF|nr:murein L,D-transpeptidase catalytic domain family protein [Rufibacter sp. LB8]
MNRIILSLSFLTVLSVAAPATSNPAAYLPQNSSSIELADLNLATNGVPGKVKPFEDFLEDIYDEADLRQAGLDYDVFQRAATGFYNLKGQGKVKKDVLTVIDFSKSSKKKRLWVIDVDKRKVLFHSLVAHGQGSGDDKAVKFSNIVNSHMSSVGFYVTQNTYHGKHGLSLKLNGLDPNFNSRANERAIVVHGADYVSESFIKQHGRLGRSHGCPALPKELNEKVISLIKNGSLLYIDAPVANYQSAYLNADKAIKSFEAEIIAKQAQILSR